MTKPEVENDADAIRKACARLETAVDTADADLWVSLYTEDAVFMAPNRPLLRGHAEIRAFMVNEFFTPFKMTLKDQTDELTVSGDLAFRRGTVTVTLTPKSGDPSIEEVFEYLEAWQRQPDGSWKISQDIFNSNKPID